MANKEIADVLELSFHTVRAASLKQHSAILIVTVRAPGGRVAALADIGLAGCGDPVTLKPGRIVAQERARK